MSDASLEEEDSSGEVSNLPSIGTAPIPEVEAVLRTADHWHFDAFKLTEVSQGYPLSTLGFWLIQQNRVAKDFSESMPSTVNPSSWATSPLLLCRPSPFLSSLPSSLSLLPLSASLSSWLIQQNSVVNKAPQQLFFHTSLFPSATNPSLLPSFQHCWVDQHPLPLPSQFLSANIHTHPPTCYAPTPPTKACCLSTLVFWCIVASFLITAA